jgi:hypothetical protein
VSILATAFLYSNYTVAVCLNLAAHAGTGRNDVPVQCTIQCCGSGSARIRIIWPDPELWMPDPDPADPDPRLQNWHLIVNKLKYIHANFSVHK